MLCLNCASAAAQQLPAVSGPNGKFEFDAGALTLPAPGFMARAAGAVTVPLGQRFGLQADFSVSSSPGFTTSAALHLFTRDPASYLIGGTLGFVRSPGAIVLAAGPEAELYRDRWTFEAWGGVSLVRPTTPAPMRLGPFVLADVGYYPVDNWRVGLGVSSLDGYNAVQISSEYLFDNFALPIAATGDIRLGQDGAIRATIGLRGYVGPDPHKTLIDRQRQDDPADRGTALYVAAGKTTLYGETPPPKPPAPPAPPPGAQPAAPTPDDSAPDPNAPAAANDPPAAPDTGTEADNAPPADGAGDDTTAPGGDSGDGTAAAGTGQTGDTGGGGSGAGADAGAGGPGGDTAEAGSGDGGSGGDGGQAGGGSGDDGSGAGAGGSAGDGGSGSDPGDGGVAGTGGDGASGDGGQSGSDTGDGSTGDDTGTGAEGGGSGTDTGGATEEPSWCETDPMNIWDGTQCTAGDGSIVSPGNDLPSDPPLAPPPDWCVAYAGFWDGAMCTTVDGDILTE